MNTLQFLAFFLLQLNFSQPAVKTFPIADFNDKVRTAEWMLAYDSAAWRMSDLVTHIDNDLLARMGREWFCFRGPDSLWNGVYGKYKDDRYDLVIHYRIIEADSIAIVEEEKVDSTLLIAVSKAINAAYAEAGSRLGKSYVRFNKFVRCHADQTITIWLLPALQPAEVAMYGGEFYYHFDRTGEKLLDRWEYLQSFKGFRFGKEREVKLEYEAMAMPPQGAVYFALQYRNRFKGVQIETKENVSTLNFSQTKGYYWEHKAKDLRKIVN
ncbi:hypothetical protein ACFOTA_03000 [Chitinophaga sp. GCM10012297]|uniref:Uncharacterized protein n=1 Tax=Chitinophaga chungangae TaxID=2821488 RepID=A0ABS3Y905_9BACT|nr:hypothetical protein [Chitinophaga chungangae]MBO9151159.1 hypothetical protein [Chitinophaga chungangae]